MFKYTITYYLQKMYETSFLFYRDQNFGLNELVSVQDVRNEFDLGDNAEESAPTPAKDKGRWDKLNTFPHSNIFQHIICCNKK